MAKIGKVWLQYICFLVLVTPSYLFAGIITGELDRSSGTVDDQFVYTLSIQGSFSGDPSFPAIEGVEARSYGRSQSVSIVNGKMTSETQFQFVLTANKAGQYTIPPIKMLVDNKSIETLPLEMKVEQAGKGSSKAGGNNGSAQAGAGIQLERSFSKTRVYVGEPVLVKIRLLVPARTKLVGAEPNFKYPSALQIKPNDKQKNYTEEIGGESYSVTELEAMLTPTREGDFAIDPATIDMRIAVPRRSLSRSPWDSLFNDTEVRQGRLRSPPATLKVLPLPTEGRRRDFSGLIGEFQLSGELSARTANPGDNLNLNLVVSGKGSAAVMDEPKLPFDTKQIKVYKDKADYQEMASPDGELESKKVFKYALVPSSPGTLNLGTVAIQTFNPELGKYQDLRFDLGEIHVAGPTAAAAKSQVPVEAQASESRDSLANASDDAKTSESRGSGVTQKAVEMKAQDLVEPHSGPKLLSASTITDHDWSNGVIALGLSAAALLVSLGFAVRKKVGGDTSRLQAAKRAFKNSRKRLDFAQQCLKKQEIAKALREAQASLREYTGAKFGAVSAAVTLRDMEEHLRSRSVNRDTLVELREVWGAMDQMIYAPPLGQNPSHGEEILKKARRVLEQMEKQCGR